ncbi:MAG: anti-sigma sporulation factor, LonB [Verrucomicrobia bacterium]|nr:anti-sigma sporulation factor, LonB [Verrucomicrobiota bacterium]
MAGQANAPAGRTGERLANPAPAIEAARTETLPVLVLRSVVMFPGTVETLTITRDSSRRLLEESLPHGKRIALFRQRGDRAEPGAAGIVTVGVVATVYKLNRRDDGSLTVRLRVLDRIVIDRVFATEPFIRAEVSPAAGTTAMPGDDREAHARAEELKSAAHAFLEERTDETASEAAAQLATTEDPGRVADIVASVLTITLEEKQALLEELDVVRRLRAVLAHVGQELSKARLGRKIHEDAKAELTDAQRREYLHEQLRIIRRELGEDQSEGAQQAAELRARLEVARVPKDVREEVERDLTRLTYLRPANPEFPLIVSYIETLTELPWRAETVRKPDLAKAQQQLDQSHFDLERVKRRLLDHLAVRKRNPLGHPMIPCLVGPPGVGKTTLAASLAEALGRKFISIGVSGMEGEGDLIGFRRTLPGALPGRIIHELCRAGARDPVIMLEDIDDTDIDFSGDEATALLEVLDTRRNKAFVDRFIGVPFDLSGVLFLATAYYWEDVPPAVRERLEMIRIPGYSDEDKREISRRYLVPRLLAEHGLSDAQCHFEDEALGRMIEDYTREGGVRGLDRQIAALCRAAVGMMEREPALKEITVTPVLVEQVLGPPKFLREARLTTANPGVVTGLAWTSVGGEIMHIEALRYPGRGGIQLTGQIGNVMKESAQAALSLLKSRVRSLGIRKLFDSDIHVHVPAGAVPKDGPSAGVAIFTAIASLCTGRRVRADVAMTGEITLRGLVLPIGGLKEKILAARRAGIPTVILPKLNEKDLADVPPSVVAHVKFVLVETVDEVLAAALEPEKKRRPKSKAKKSKARKRSPN